MSDLAMIIWWWWWGGLIGVIDLRLVNMTWAVCVKNDDACFGDWVYLNDLASLEDPEITDPYLGSRRNESLLPFGNFPLSSDSAWKKISWKKNSIEMKSV